LDAPIAYDDHIAKYFAVSCTIIFPNTLSSRRCQEWHVGQGIGHGLKYIGLDPQCGTAKSRISATCGRLYLCDALLQPVPQNLQDMAAEFLQLIQEEDPVVREGPLTRPQHVAPPIKPTSEMG
jgi:hypothetical protein